MSRQQSGKRGKRSTAQKWATSRHDFEPIPATSKVNGATGGNRPTGRTAAEVIGRYTVVEMLRSAARLREAKATGKEKIE